MARSWQDSPSCWNPKCIHVFRSYGDKSSLPSIEDDPLPAELYEEGEPENEEDNNDVQDSIADNGDTVESDDNAVNGANGDLEGACADMNTLDIDDQCTEDSQEATVTPGELTSLIVTWPCLFFSAL